VIGLAEMMNFPGVIGGDERELAKLRLEGASHVDGHAPGVLGKALNAYAAAGIRSDHEAYTAEEGRQRLRAGMWLLIREASAARNLEALLPVVREFGPARIAFCTDDREPEHIVDEGHVNSIVRASVAQGIAPEDALVMASHNAATWHGLTQLGAIAPGYQADLLVLADLERFDPDLVLKRGRPVGEFARPIVPEWVKHTVRVQPTSAEDFALRSSADRVRVIGVVPDQIVTTSLVEEPPLRDGHVVADPSRDLAKVAVVERHLGTGRIGLGLVQGFGLREGAIASTIAHDAHNIVAVGMADADLQLAVARLVELGGGIVVVARGEVRAELPLPVAGLLADLPLQDVVDASRACADAARELGCTLPSPFQSLAFLALSVIPSLKITDHGLVDVDRFELVPFEV
jgi:adenine deaminase